MGGSTSKSAATLLVGSSNLGGTSTTVAEQGQRLALEKVSSLLESRDALHALCKDLHEHVSDDGRGGGVSRTGLRMLTRLVIDGCQVSDPVALQELLEVLAPLPNVGTEESPHDGGPRLGFSGFVCYARCVLRVLDAALRAEAQSSEKLGLVSASLSTPSPNAAVVCPRMVEGVAGGVEASCNASMSAPGVKAVGSASLQPLSSVARGTLRNERMQPHSLACRFNNGTAFGLDAAVGQNHSSCRTLEIKATTPLGGSSVVGDVDSTEEECSTQASRSARLGEAAAGPLTLGGGSCATSVPKSWSGVARGSAMPSSLPQRSLSPSHSQPALPTTGNPSSAPQSAQKLRCLSASASQPLLAVTGAQPLLVVNVRPGRLSKSSSTVSVESSKMIRSIGQHRGRAASESSCQSSRAGSVDRCETAHVELLGAQKKRLPFACGASEYSVGGISHPLGVSSATACPVVSCCIASPTTDRAITRATLPFGRSQSPMWPQRGRAEIAVAAGPMLICSGLPTRARSVSPPRFVCAQQQAAALQPAQLSVVNSQVTCSARSVSSTRPGSPEMEPRAFLSPFQGLSCRSTVPFSASSTLRRPRLSMPAQCPDPYASCSSRTPVSRPAPLPTQPILSMSVAPCGPASLAQVHCTRGNVQGLTSRPTSPQSSCSLPPGNTSALIGIPKYTFSRMPARDVERLQSGSSLDSLARAETSALGQQLSSSPSVVSHWYQQQPSPEPRPLPPRMSEHLQPTERRSGFRTTVDGTMKATNSTRRFPQQLHPAPADAAGGGSATPGMGGGMLEPAISHHVGSKPLAVSGEGSRSGTMWSTGGDATMDGAEGLRQHLERRRQQLESMQERLAKLSRECESLQASSMKAPRECTRDDASSFYSEAS